MGVGAYPHVALGVDLASARNNRRDPGRPSVWAERSAWVYLTAIFLFLFLPNALVAVTSFDRDRIAEFPIHDFTATWWRGLFANSTIWSAVQSSLAVATVTTMVAVFLGLFSAYAISRFHFPFKRLFIGLLFGAMAVPYLVFGIALLSFYALLGIERGLPTAILAHVALALPYTTLVLMARLQGFDHSIEEAAESLGAGHVVIFLRVTMPQLMAGIIAGAALAFTTSFDEFNVAYFVIGADNTTIPLYIYSSLRFGMSPELNALATLTLGVSILLGAVALRKSRSQPPK
jgi:spermidine/putrescine transport system permease protein